MEKSEKIRQMLFQMAKELGPAPTMLARVKSVNETERTCVLVDDQTDLPYEDVQLRPVQDSTKSITLIPKVNTWALAVRIEDQDEWMVIAVGEADKILINSPEIIFNDGNNGGMVNWPDVKAELDKTNEVVNALKQALTGFVPVAGDGGSALKTYAATQLSGKNVGDYANKEDLTVKH
ncbi:MAG: hypothetical protein HOP30_21685 [Cyclobacteriaceae bacterium]|nr:hypothetical protein [Cyclobacteriaceae bacterium]